MTNQSFNRASASNGFFLDPAEQIRYARQLSLPEFGLQGQAELKKGRILCVGAGGLGSPALIYLAAAGVGKIGIIDPDVVDTSNLHRQIVHGDGDVGTPKIQSAAAKLKDINPHVEVHCHEGSFTKENAIQIAREYDIIVDGTDNFATRYLTNDVAYLLGKPNVYGSVLRFEGQCSVFAPHLGGPCYRCLFPQPPKKGVVPNCAEGGVLGVLPGIIGTIQALEAIKLLTQAGESLVGRLVHFDALTFRMREFSLKRDKNCPLCGENPEITALGNYDDSCEVLGGTRNESDCEAQVPSVSVNALAAKLMSNHSILLDVREDFETNICRIPEAVFVPLADLEARYLELDPKIETFVLCKSGYRSEIAATFLLEKGFKRVFNVTGGIDEWAKKIDHEMPRY